MEELIKENARLREQLEASAILIMGMQARIEELTRKVEELTREQNKNSSNSQKPPSSDGLGVSNRTHRKKKPRSGRKRGGQRGHKGHYRALLPEEAVDKIIDIYPKRCEVCLGTLPEIPDCDPFRHQVVDIEENGRRQITEYRRHTVRCCCGEIGVAPEEEVPRYVFGPRLSGVVSMLTGVYHLSRRQVTCVLKELFGIDISLGTVSNIEGRMTQALEGSSEEAMAEVAVAKVKHIDETSWLREAERCSLWVFASQGATVFRISADGRRESLQQLMNTKKGILVSDRGTVFLYWPMERRQICWAHLKRMFIGFSERDGPIGVFGQELLAYAKLVFRYWRKYRLGDISREQWRLWTQAVRDAMKPCLERAVNAQLPELSGSCENMLAHFEAMWRFMDTPGVEPTNNHAERELRRIVMWRKRCFGSQSDRGDRFVERVMTVAYTLRKKGGVILHFFQQQLNAFLTASPQPRLCLSP